MGISSALIMINKYIMSTDGFAYPMALSCLGMLFSSVASYLACRVSPASLSSHLGTSFLAKLYCLAWNGCRCCLYRQASPQRWGHMS